MYSNDCVQGLVERERHRLPQNCRVTRSTGAAFRHQMHCFPTISFRSSLATYLVCLPRGGQPLSLDSDCLRLLNEASPGHRGQLDAHPLVREYFADEFSKQDATTWQAAHRRLFTYYSDSSKYLPETITEMAPLYHAIIHGCKGGVAEAALKDIFLPRVYRFPMRYNWAVLGDFGGQLPALAAFFDSPWDSIRTELPTLWQALVFNEMGCTLRNLGRLEDSIRPFERATELCITLGQWSNAAADVGNLSETHLAMGSLSDAAKTARRAVEFADRSLNGLQQMDMRTSLGDVLHNAGSLDAAAAVFRETENLNRAINPTNPRLFGVPGHRYCELLLTMGFTAEALDRAEEMVVSRAQGGSTGPLYYGLERLSLGRALHTSGSMDRAGNVLIQAVEDLRKASQWLYLPRGLLARASWQLAKGNLSVCEHDLLEVQSVATRFGMKLYEADFLIEYARLTFRRGNEAAAAKRLEQAQTIINAIGYNRRRRDLQTVRSEVFGEAT